MSELSGYEAPRTQRGAYNSKKTSRPQEDSERKLDARVSSESSKSSGSISSSSSSSNSSVYCGVASGQARLGSSKFSSKLSTTSGSGREPVSESTTSGQRRANNNAPSAAKPSDRLQESGIDEDSFNRSSSDQVRATAQSTTASGATGSQRISSIDILNENRQRQLQFKQQESFKQHLEQRQKQLIEQQQKQQQQGQQGGETDLGVLTYQVNTDAPEYMAMAVAKSGATGGDGGASSQAKRSPQVAASGGIAVNPFEEPEKVADDLRVRPKRAAADVDKSATVSGKSGFLSALMDEASFDANQSGRLDDSNEELNSARAARKSQSLTGGAETRYARLAGATPSYNYDEPPDKRPFYQRDLATLLQDCRSSRKLVILIVAIALLLDNMLLTSVVPIIPAHLYKLRIERQHRELLEGNKSLFVPADKSAKTGSSEEELLQAELDRRINQSLAGFKDRYSGSVFHPRVRVGQKELVSGLRPDPADRDERDWAQVTGNERWSARGNGNGSDDDDNDDNDDDGIGDEAPDKTGGRRKTSAMQRQNSRKQQPSRKLATGPATDDDEYEDDSEDGNVEQNAKGEMRSPKGAARGEVMPSSPAESLSRIMKEQSKSSEVDGDDEDALDAYRWQKLKSSLVSMARKSGNDTDALAGMILDYVMADSSESKPDDKARPEARNGANDRSRPLKASAKASVKQAGPTSNQPGDANERVATGRRPRRATASARPETRSLPPRLMARPTNRRPNEEPRAESASSTTAPPPPSVAGGEDKDEPLIISHQDIVDESFEVGVMFASKPIVQAFANPFIGTLTNKVGFTIPMFTGFVIMFLSTLVFAFGSSYSTLFVARAIQGVGSACTSVAGMSMLADRFPDDAERGNAMAIALGGLALGVVIGPPFGGFMYEFVGKSSPFIVLSILALLDGLLQLLVLQPRVTENQEEGASLMTLIKDPYILVAAGAITFANTGIAILEPALPLWMMDTMHAKNWEQGVAFLPAALSYMCGTNLFGNLGLKIGRWRATMIGLIIIGCSLLLIPFATRVDHLIIPNGAIGFAMGMVDSTMMPMLGYLVDIRHTSVYGSVYAIGDVAFCASFAFGPALSGTLVELIGFEGLIKTTALICFAFAPLLFLLRDPPARQLNEAQLQEQSSLRYVNYNQLDSPDEDAQLTSYAKSNSKTYVR